MSAVRFRLVGPSTAARFGFMIASGHRTAATRTAPSGETPKAAKVLARFARDFPPFDGWCGRSPRLSDLAEAKLYFRFNAMGFGDDAVERFGVFLEFVGVVVGGHYSGMISALQAQ